MQFWSEISSESKAPQIIHATYNLCTVEKTFEAERIQFDNKVLDTSTKQVDSISGDQLQELRYTPETTRTIPPR